VDTFSQNQIKMIRNFNRLENL